VPFSFISLSSLKITSKFTSKTEIVNRKEKYAECRMAEREVAANIYQQWIKENNQQRRQ
jgi:hypothetical protein